MPASGEWSYTTANFYGTDSFTVTITDDAGGATTQAISLTINAVDDSAVVSSSSSPAHFRAEATDVEGLTDGSVFSVSSEPTNGSDVASGEGLTDSTGPIPSPSPSPMT